MTVLETKRFGNLTYDEKDVITLPDGLIGMPDLRRWLMVEMGENLPIRWLQSLDRGDFGLPVTTPYFFSESYQVLVAPEIGARIDAEPQTELTVLIITTIQSGGTRVTGNLLSPLLISSESRRGVQVVLEDDTLPLQQELDYAKFNLAVQSPAEENRGEAAIDAEAEVQEQENQLTSLRS